MNRDYDSWIIDALKDIEEALVQREFEGPAQGLALVRKQLAAEIGAVHEMEEFESASNVIRLFG